MFFNEVVLKIRGNDDIVTLIDSSNLPKERVKDVLKGIAPKMSNVNFVLLTPEIRRAVWTCLNIDQSVALPVFGADLMYGLLSMRIHAPGVPCLYLSDKLDQEFKDFWKALSGRIDLPIDIYSEEAAAFGEELTFSGAIGDSTK